MRLSSSVLLLAALLGLLAASSTAQVVTSGTATPTSVECTSGFIRDQCTGTCKSVTDPSIDEDLDCQGVCFASPKAFINSCGNCVGGTTGLPDDEGVNCAGTCDTLYATDVCGICAPVDLLDIDKPYIDCMGTCFGSYSYDECGSCTSSENPAGPLPNYQRDACGVCFGNNETCTDCFDVVNGGAVRDNCDVCGGDDSTCMTTTLVTPAAVPLLASGTRYTFAVSGAGFAANPSALCQLTGPSPSVAVATFAGTVLSGSSALCEAPFSSELGVGSYEVRIFAENGAYTVPSATVYLYPSDLAFSTTNNNDYDGSAITVTATAGSIPTDLAPSVRFTDSDTPALYAAQTLVADSFDASSIQVAAPTTTTTSVKFALHVTFNGVDFIPVANNIIFRAAAPVVSSAVWTNTGSGVQVAFAAPGIHSIPTTTCSSYFTSTTLGNGATCVLTTATTLTISFSADNSFATTENLIPVAGAIVAYDQRYTKPLTTAITTTAPVAPVAPAVTLLGNTLVGQCNDLTLTWSSLASNVGFAWEVTDLNGIDGSTTLVDYLTANTVVGSGLLVVPRAQLTSGARYSIKFSLTFFTASSSSTHVVDITVDQIPTATITSLSGLNLARGNQNKFQVSVAFLSCVPSQAMTYAWTLSDATLNIEFDLAALSIPHDLQVITFPPFTFVPGHQYLLSVAATVVSSGVVASVSGMPFSAIPPRISADVVAPALVDASGSISVVVSCSDVDQTSGACNYAVNCLDNAGVVCHDKLGAKLVPTLVSTDNVNNIATFSINLNNAYAGGVSLAISALVTKNGASAASLTSNVNIRKPANPSITIKYVLPTTATLSSTDSLQADASHTGDSLVWTTAACVGCNTIPNIAAVACTTTTPTGLCVPPSALVPGGLYQFVATSTNAAGSSSVSFTRRVAPVPFGGSVKYVCTMKSATIRSCNIIFSQWKDASGTNAVYYKVFRGQTLVGSASNVHLGNRKASLSDSVACNIYDAYTNSFTSITVNIPAVTRRSVLRRDAISDNNDNADILALSLDEADDLLESSQFSDALSLVSGASADYYSSYVPGLGCSDLASSIAAAERVVDILGDIVPSITFDHDAATYDLYALGSAPNLLYGCLSSVVQIDLENAVETRLQATTSNAFVVSTNSPSASAIDNDLAGRLFDFATAFDIPSSYFAGIVRMISKGAALTYAGNIGSVSKIVSTDGTLQFSSAGAVFTAGTNTGPLSLSAIDSGDSPIGSVNLAFSALDTIYPGACVINCQHIIRTAWVHFASNPTGFALPGIEQFGAFAEVQVVDATTGVSNSNFGPGLTITTQRTLATPTGLPAAVFFDVSTSSWLQTGISNNVFDADSISFDTTHTTVFGSATFACSAGTFYDSSSDSCEPCDWTCATCSAGTDQDCLSCTAPRFLESGNCSLPDIQPCQPLSGSPACSADACYAVLVIEAGYTCTQYSGPAGYTYAGFGTYCDVVGLADPTCDTYAPCVDASNGKSLYPNNPVCWFRAP